MLQTYSYLIPGPLLFILCFLVVLFPYWFILRKYEKRFGNFFSEKFWLFHILQLTWMVVSLSIGILIGVFFADGSTSSKLAVFAMIEASLVLPPSLFCALTGIYPEMTRRGYYYYDSSKENSILLDSEPLKITGWIQFVLLAGIVGSSLYIIW